MVEFAAKHCLLQVVDGPTHAAECIDLIWTNNCDLVSSCWQEDCSQFSDHKLVTANTTYRLNQKQEHLDQQYLCSTGKRFKSLDYSKAPWPEIEQDLQQIDWQPMEEIARNSPTEALVWFHEKVLNILEDKLPNKKARQSGGHSKLHRMRKLLWRRLAKVECKLKCASTMHKKAKLLQQKWDLEKQLADDYLAVNTTKENEAVLRIK